MTKLMQNQLKKLEKLKPCSEAVYFAEDFDTPQAAWDACERGDWMLWLLGKISGSPKSKSRKQLVLAACKCARLALKYVAKSEKRPLKAIKTAEGWARGEQIKLTDVRAAASAAHAAASAAASAAAHAAHAAASAADAASAAASAAYAAYAAASAAYAAAYAASAASAAYAAAYAAAEKETLKNCANIVRKFYPKPPKL